MKKFLAILLSAILALSCMAALADAEKTVTVALYAATGVEEAWNAVAKAYEELHPDVKVVVDLKPQEGYEDWVKAQFASWETTTPEADIVYGNLAGNDRNYKTIDFLPYAYDDNPYADGTWSESIAFDLQAIDVQTGMWDCISITGVQVLWFYNADIFAEVGVTAPTTWDELVDVCEKLAAAGYQPIAMAGDFNSFWSGQMGWTAQAYADQTTRSQIEIIRAQEGDYCYEDDKDADFVYDPTDPHNDDPGNVNPNPVRFYKAFVQDGTIRCDTDGMKTIWNNFSKVFPKYTGGAENFYGTDKTGAKTLFLQQKAAIWLDGSWFFGDYLNVMNSIDADEAVTIGNADYTGLKKFALGTFTNPSMDGAGIEAPARTIEVATGFLSAIKKDADHNELVTDFLMFYTSPIGYSAFMKALIEAKGVPDGLPLVNGIELEGQLAEMFANINYIGNCQKGFCQALARGIGDNQEALRAWYGYSMDLLNGAITVDQWAEMHQANQLKYAPDVMAAVGISMADLENPQNEPTGN